METKTNFDQTLNKIKPILTGMGINLFSKNTSLLTTLKYKFLYIFNVINLHIVVTAALAWFIVGVTEGKSLTELTYFGPCFVLSWLATIKSGCLWLNEDMICDLMDEIRNLEIEESKKATATRRIIVNKEVKFLHVELIVFIIAYAFLNICFTLSALFLVCLKYMKDQVWEPILPFLSIYPFELTFNRWLLVYLHQILAGFICTSLMGCADYLYFICCTYIHIHFKLLQDDFENLIPKKLHRLFKEDEEIHAKLVRLINSHQILIRCVNRIEDVYGKSSLFNFVTSSMIICMSGFNVTTISDLPVVLTYMLFLMMSLLQTFFLCFYGDMVMKSSMAISDAIYNSQWYATDCKFAKVLHIILLRAQKPCKLTAYRFTDINLGAFTVILSRSWSYFALLKTMYK